MAARARKALLILVPLVLALVAIDYLATCRGIKMLPRSGIVGCHCLVPLVVRLPLLVGGEGSKSKAECEAAKSKNAAESHSVGLCFSSRSKNAQSSIEVTGLGNGVLMIPISFRPNLARALLCRAAGDSNNLPVPAAFVL